MSSITFNCPKCYHLLVMDERSGGAQVDCPQCKTTTTIPTSPKTFLSESATTSVIERTCPQCAATIPAPDALFCLKCGTSLMTAPKKYCQKCKAELAPESSFCSHCGTDLKEQAMPAPFPTDQSPKLQQGVQGAATKAAIFGDENRCLYCGGELGPNDASCAGCGRDLRPGNLI